MLNKIRSILPDHLASHLIGCVVTNGKILIYTDSAEWATPIRFYHRELLQTLRSRESLPFQTLQVRISNLNDTTQSTRTPVIPNQSDIDSIRNGIDSVSDPGLKNALSSLCNTIQKLHDVATPD